MKIMQILDLANTAVSDFDADSRRSMNLDTFYLRTSASAIKVYSHYNRW
jgi:hypothetical protein